MVRIEAIFVAVYHLMITESNPTGTNIENEAYRTRSSSNPAVVVEEITFPIHV